MTKRQWLIVLALAFIAMLVAIDMRWIDVEPDTHLPTWLGLSLAAFYVSHLVRD